MACYHGCRFTFLKSSARSLRPIAKLPAPLRAPSEHSFALQGLAQIDAQALGISREKHHRFLINDNAIRGVALHSGDGCIGYVYVSSDGHVGPLAVAQPNAMDAVF